MADDEVQEDARSEGDYYPSPGRVALDTRGRWFDEFREDLGRYRAHHGGSVVKPLLLEQGLWALFQYRWASGVYRSRLPALFRAPLLALSILGQKWAEMATGVCLPFSAEIYPGQYIGHFGPVVVNSEAVLHSGCNISQGVTLGISGRGPRRGAPTIGPRVYIGANAVVAGQVTVGADCVLAANSLINRDVAANSTAVGVPAVVTEGRGTQGMGLHQIPVLRQRPSMAN